MSTDEQAVVAAVETTAGEQVTSNSENAVVAGEEVTAQPTIRATFDLNNAGEPKAIATGDLKHYQIKLHVEGAPEDTYAVTYLLDSSYVSPVREVLDAKEGFEEQLTSYGDYTVQAKIRTRDGVTIVALPLSKALAQSYGEQPSAPIAAALQDIAAL